MTNTLKSSELVPGIKYRDAAKMALIPVKEVQETKLPKPSWLKIKLPTENSAVNKIKAALRANGLHSVCEEAACPNLSECFTHGTATFMILGAICTRRCPFCDVAHGKPLPPDELEPEKLAKTVQDMGLKYVVITSVDRDDLRDGGAGHFAKTVKSIRGMNPKVKIELLVPDFRGRMDVAIELLTENAPDVFNHNLENVPRLYKEVRPGANYEWSLKLLKTFKQNNPDVKTKSGLMVGLGETNDEILQVMQDLRANGVTMLTLGQYLQPSRDHFPVKRYVSPEEFELFRVKALEMGFEHAACGPLVRSSYHADLQAKGIEVK